MYVLLFILLYLNLIFLLDLDLAIHNYTNIHGKEPQKIIHSNYLHIDHSPEIFKQFPALIFIPYQVSVMSFFEMFRQNIPIIAPSLELLIKWQMRIDIKPSILESMVYGTPNRHTDLIKNFANTTDLHLSDPYDIQDLISNNYWLKFSDIYQFKHITYFESWYEQ